jgi:hypothetical protein
METMLPTQGKEVDEDIYVFSSGGGRQSSAALILSAKGIFPYKTHIFCNVGEDSEDNKTLQWVRNILVPYAEKNGIEFIVASKGGKTLYQAINTTRYSIPIPAKFFYKNGKKNIGMRACTNEYKIRVSDHFIKTKFGDKINPPNVRVGLGISMDEFQRAKVYPIRKMGSVGEIKDNKGIHYWNKIQEYPLIFCSPFSLFGKEFKDGLTVSDCMWIVEQEGLGIPPKSACWFCPFHSIEYWKNLALKDDPLYHKGVELEQLLQQKEKNMKIKYEIEGREFNEFGVYLTDFQVNLSNILKANKDGLDENCESGYCFV